VAEYYDLGSYSRTVTTASPEAQLWFDRGLVWCYGFHNEEAVRCFQRAAEADPGCAMAHWGIAYALGPNYNKPWEAFDQLELADVVARAHAAVRSAAEHAVSASPLERALIEALSKRYPAALPADDCSVWIDAYAGAMRRVYAEFADDPDVAALFAEALMQRTPWQLWDIEAGTPADGADTLEILAVLERAMDEGSGRPLHPGVLHFYVHAMEMSPHPERALHAADALRDLVPDSGHLRHMATHIDVLCGFYRDVIVTNELAIAADRTFLEREGALNFYTLYRCHNYHFKLYGAMFLGDPGAALEAADELAATLGEDLLRTTSPPMADWVEGFVSMRLHALIRFGLWQDIIAAPLPVDPELYCVTTAMLQYAKGVAHAALGEIAAAENHERLFRAAQVRVPDSRMIFNNTCADILTVAAEMLAGEIAYRKGEFNQAFAHLRRSVELDDALPYDEPWGWMQPTRHALGALLLEQGRIADAEAVYRADLGLDGTVSRPCQHPENVWSLHGYHECLLRLGKASEAELVSPRLQLAAARATVPIGASCFCRGAAMSAAAAESTVAVE
jgi:tetratricopeptide (TPR) repeat protein